MKRSDWLSCWHLSVWLVLADVTLSAATTKPEEPALHSIDFNQDVRPLLSDRCFLCHGPDEATREAGLRLDQRGEAVASGAIVPGDVDASELVARILSGDPDTIMPPPEFGKPLSRDEIQILQTWIETEAPYQSHWAFEPPRSPVVPPVQNEAWCRNDIDRFVLARLEAVGKKPSTPATVETLTRRLHFDLTGLPPGLQTLNRMLESGSVIETEAFFGAMIKGLMRSPQFGERWGRWWLDAARYADSAGYEKDMPREVWFYRDWVVRAMNEDLPYDEFILRQIAGDLLPGATQADRVATGFLRNSMTNEEGGADPEQFRVEGLFDRMDAIGKSILGITTQCAQCHTHKYDPLSHQEYYQLFAALNDFHEGSISVFTDEQARRRDDVLTRVAAIRNVVKSSVPDWCDRVTEFAQIQARKQLEWKTMLPTERPFEGQKFRVLGDGSIVSESYAPTKADNRFSLTAEIGTLSAVRIDALTHPQLPRGGPGRSVDGTGAITEFGLTITPQSKDGKPINVKFRKAVSDVNPPRRRLKSYYRNKDSGKDDRVTGPAAFAIDGDAKTAWTNDLGPGRSNRDCHIVFIPEAPVVVNGPAQLTFRLQQKHGGWNSDDNQNFLVGRYRFSVSETPLPSEETGVPVGSLPSAVEGLIPKPSTDWSTVDWDRVFDVWWRSQPEWQNQVAEHEKAWQHFPETASQLVVKSRTQARKTFVLARGDFLKPTQAVEVAAPAFLNPMEDAGAPDRLRLARWLVSDNAPTTPRVVVNRIWQAYFGRGLVKTSEDFGFQSSPPTHPDLLDFLATELIESGWSLKHIHRLIIDSATYRQASNASRAHYRDDPDNQWLSRGPRLRLPAEMVRDGALFASGLIDMSVGGPPVYPPAPGFLFLPPTSYGPKVWNTRQDGSEYRRSLYVQQYRSVPYPPLQMFDAPKGDAACVRRPRSNTPLQALVLLNEPQFVDAARALAARILRENASMPSTAATDRDRIIHGFRLTTSRHPDADEIDVIAAMLREQRQRFASQPEAALDVTGMDATLCRQILGVANGELAAWFVVARTLLNLDEAITKS
ncbi:MAG: PSD1 and planctomycete cytochrome C domain-containing protein [Planctomycetota bacterium]